VTDILHKAGSLIVPRVTSTWAIWSMLIGLLAIHLGTNYLAVRSVSMRTLNRQRNNILFSNLFETGITLSPHEVSQHERIFETDGALRWRSDLIIGVCRIGVSLRELLVHVAKEAGSSADHSATQVAMSGRSWPNTKLDLNRLFFNTFAKEKYVLWYNRHTHEAMIVLRTGASTRDQLKAWTHALLLSHEFHKAEAEGQVPDSYSQRHTMVAILEATLAKTSELWVGYEQQLQAVGWDLSVSALETLPGVRIDIV
jgi:hypothetical protein